MAVIWEVGDLETIDIIKSMLKMNQIFLHLRNVNINNYQKFES